MGITYNSGNSSTGAADTRLHNYAQGQVHKQWFVVLCDGHNACVMDTTGHSARLALPGLRRAAAAPA